MFRNLPAIPVLQNKWLGAKELDCLFVERRMETERNLGENVEKEEALM